VVPAAHLPTNNMSKAYYLPADDDGKGSWLDNLSVKLPSYQLALGLTPEDVTSLAADAAYFAFALKAQTRVSTYSQQWTAYKNAARNGTGTTLGLMPVAPNLGTPPAQVAPGIIGRATALVARIKAATGYTESIGQALQIIGPEHPIDLTTLKPVLNVMLDAGQVLIRCVKQGMGGSTARGGTGFMGRRPLPR